MVHKVHTQDCVSCWQTYVGVSGMLQLLLLSKVSPFVMNLPVGSIYRSIIEGCVHDNTQLLGSQLNVMCFKAIHCLWVWGIQFSLNQMYLLGNFSNVQVTQFSPNLIVLCSIQTDTCRWIDRYTV